MKSIEIDEAELRELVEVQKVQQWKIAEKFGCSEDTVNRRCKKLGLTTQRTGARDGDQHHNWKGGVMYQKGYRYLYMPEHPNARKAGYIAEHRLVMEEKLGRLLGRKEVCHHIDGNPLNNHESNLAVYENNGEHLADELAGRRPNWTPEGWAKIRRQHATRTKSVVDAQQSTPPDDHRSS